MLITLSDILAGHDPLDSTTITDDFIPLDLSQDIDISRIRIGIPQEYHCPGISDEVVETWSEVTDILEKAGGEVVQVDKEHSCFLHQLQDNLEKLIHWQPLPYVMIPLI
jgi:Asp-tRNA(Asn)/Glu-tRNA(Gln) amidotransferase A subunit family amidase